MALTRTIAQLVASCQLRADKKDDGHVETAEWQEYISELYGELHGVVAETGARYFETEATITATGASSYSLPADHLSTVGVDLVLDSTGRRRPLDELMVQERDIFSGRTGDAHMFAFTGASIVLYPTPSTGSYKHIYVPQPTDLTAVAASTAVDLINNDGLKFLVWGVASIALHKGEVNQQRAMVERDAARSALVEWAVRRAMTTPKRRMVRDAELGDGIISSADWRYR